MDDAELDRRDRPRDRAPDPEGNGCCSSRERSRPPFYVLLHGRLKVVKVTPDGQQVVIRFVDPGDIYGIAKALRRKDYPATATALVDSVTLAWDMAIWDDFMARHPAFARNVMQMMGQRLQEAHTRLKEMSTEEVEHRVAHAVLRLVTQSGRKMEEGVLVDFPITHQDIAEVSGTTLHSVSRVLERLGEVLVSSSSAAERSSSATSSGSPASPKATCGGAARGADRMQTERARKAGGQPALDPADRDADIPCSAMASGPSSSAPPSGQSSRSRFGSARFKAMWQLAPGYGALRLARSRDAASAMRRPWWPAFS